MITNCVTKDINSQNDNIKSNALKLLPLILDTLNPLQVERMLKLALISKNSNVVDSAL